jgi:hypothetical protein
MPRSRVWARNNGSGYDTGAALVEMAVLMPLLVLLIIGVFEIGGAFKDVLTTSNAVRDGTRLLSARGDEGSADCDALVAAVDALELAANFGDLDRIEIFKSDLSGEPVPGFVNTYRWDPTDLDDLDDETDCEDWDETVAWDPRSRNVLVGVTPLDIVGMRIVYVHDWYTGLPPFSGSFTIDEQTITRLEPEGYE